jgi:hypothetical protein
LFPDACRQVAEKASVLAAIFTADIRSPLQYLTVEMAFSPPSSGKLLELKVD